MFYRPEDGHGLPHNPFNALIVPRPIGWVSTRGTAGIDNLAPYSFFNGCAYEPPQVMFATTGTKPDRDGTKDSLANIRETGVFCVNLVEAAMTEAMNVSSTTLPAGVSEFDRAGLTRIECETIACARVAGAGDGFAFDPGQPGTNAKPSPAPGSRVRPRRWNAA